MSGCYIVASVTSTHINIIKNEFIQISRGFQQISLQVL
jgi:hypothetical protein